MKSHSSLHSKSKVQVFGEFSEASPEGAWNQKLTCELNEDASSFSALVRIRLGHKFKFIIDGGKHYAVSQDYVNTKDQAGNLNNVFQFHQRSLAQNEAVKSSYPVSQSGKSFAKGQAFSRIDYMNLMDG